MNYYITTDEICEIYGVSRQAVKNWRDKGLEYFEKGPKRFRYDPKDVEHFVKTKTRFVMKGV